MNAYPLILSALIVSGCISGLTNETLNGLQACDQKHDARQKDICIISVAEDTNDLNICTRVGDPRYRQVCIGRLAVKRQDPELCDKIPDSMIRSECKVSARGMVSAVR